MSLTSKVPPRVALDQLWKSGRVRVDQYESLKRALDRLDELALVAAEIRTFGQGIAGLSTQVAQLRADLNGMKSPAAGEG